MLEPITIKATDLSDAWHQTLFKCVEVGQQFIIDRGSNAGQKRCELDFITVHITRPGDLPLLPKVNPVLNIPDPVAPGYLDDYMPYLMTGAEKEGACCIDCLQGPKCHVVMNRRTAKSSGEGFKS